MSKVISKFSNEEKYKEAEREVRMRQEVYGRNAPEGRMTDRQTHQIEIMLEIAAEYRALAEKERLL